MTHHTDCHGDCATHPYGVADLRRELGMTQQQFGQRLGLANKASVSLIERGVTSCSLRIALLIEELSGGRIDAAELCEDVRLARHGASSTAPANSGSTGKNCNLSSGEAAQ